jgi:hypothetical protein
VALLLRFSDAPNVTPHETSHYEGLLGESYPALGHYYREASYDQLNITGSDVFGWYNLPNPWSYYRESEESTLPDMCRLMTDAVAVTDTDVDFRKYFGILLFVNQDIGNRGRCLEMTLDGETRLWAVSAIQSPDWQSLVAHEMTHGMGRGLHSCIVIDGDHQSYESRWDVLSKGGTGGFEDRDNKTYGNIAPHPIGEHKLKLGWIPESRLFTAEANSTRVITLTRLARPPAGGYLLAKIPFPGASTSYYTVEARMRVGYDKFLPNDCVLIHEVPGHEECHAVIIDNDGNNNPNDDGAMWLPGETFIKNGIMVSVLDSTDTGYLVGISTAPRDPCYVDVSNTRTEDGTRENPFNEVLEGVAAVEPNGGILIAPGVYRENIVIRKPCRLARNGSTGSVIIGK